MKKLATIVILSIITLTGCGAQSNTDIEVEGNNEIFSSNEFSIEIPSQWETISKENFTSNVPSNTVVAFLSNEKSENFNSNVNITRTNNENNVSLEDFSKSSVANAKKILLEFSETNKNTEKINGLEAITYIFSGKQDADQPIVSFQQSFIKTESAFYIITFAYLPDEEKTNIDKVQKTINTFTLI